VSEFLSGAITALYFVAGLYFFKFWNRTRDPLFVLFGIAFWILCAQRAALSMTADRFEDDTFFYMVRLSAFLIILLAIGMKNRSTKG
jgi:hypothetical protein